ncbi:hypothetical protein [Alkalihalobacterium alkalinitrilicum]|uniref:hypothetical protein n=1 Tax=Alkalihalobacterium alkalinitrilicum TaxID=427920 RepID=UPI0009954EF4|nr:hypothetical protein [Alkalihalobacterium alkalinitrilicum]
MNINIDLLPQRVKTKEGGFPVIPVAGVLTVVATASLLTYTYFDTKSSVQSLEEQILAQTEVQNTLQQDFLTKTTGLTEYNYVEQYTHMNRLLGSIYKDTIDTKERVYMLLPEKAEVNNYSFVNSGELSMQITFQSKGDAAIYLNRLLNADLVSSAEVQTISTNDQDLVYQSQFTLMLHTLVGEES